MTRWAATGLYLLGMLAANGLLLGAGFIAAFHPHQDFWGALDMMTSFTGHEWLWIVGLALASALVAVDVLFRWRGLHGEDSAR